MFRKTLLFVLFTVIAASSGCYDCDSGGAASVSSGGSNSSGGDSSGGDDTYTPPDDFPTGCADCGGGATRSELPQWDTGTVYDRAHPGRRVVIIEIGMSRGH